jgi:hypothetical protein
MNEWKPGNRTRIKCACGFATPWRTVSDKPPKCVIVQPYLCPKCGAELASTTVIR